jgi:hypothetical protein
MNLRWALNQVGALAFTGLAAGAFAGWVGVASQDGAAAVAGAAARWRFALFAALPFAAILRAWLDSGAADRDAYRDQLPAMAAATVGLTAIGAAIGAALWLFAVTQIAGVFGGETAADVMRAVRPLFGWNGAAIAVAAGAGGGLAGALVGRVRAGRS